MAYQYGQDLSGWTPQDLATRLGTYQGQIGYESNDAGSFERNYNEQLGRLTPEMLLRRYKAINNQGHLGTAVDRMQAQAYREAVSALGRDITPAEFSQILPYFMTSNGVSQGRAFLAQMVEQEKMNPNSPLSPYNPQNPRNTLAQRNPEVQAVFQDLLKRGATQDELNHFSQMLATGQADAFTLRNFVSQLPEYRTAQDAEFRGNVAKELEGYDTSAFNKQKQDILSYYANQGMPAGTSPSLDYALTDLMGKIADKRQSFLTGLSADQYNKNTGAARDDYNTYLSRAFESEDWGRNRGAEASDYLRGRLGERQDYDQQRNDYMNFLNSQRGRRSSPWGQLAGGLIGAGIGGYTGGPTGASAGWNIGSGVGGGYDYYRNY